VIKRCLQAPGPHLPIAGTQSIEISLAGAQRFTKLATMVDMKPIARAMPWVARSAAMVSRYRTALAYYRPKLRQIHAWTLRSRERTNFTYDLEPVNIEYLAAFTSAVTGAPCDEILSYFDELQHDLALKAHVARTVAQDPDYRWRSDPNARYGRRLGWYAIVRAQKPKVVVETGVDKGLGSLVLTSALLRNRRDGYAGEYFGLDIDPGAGHLLHGEYASCGRILVGDSCDSLKNLNRSIDLFIGDSDHSASYEELEYETAAPKFSSSSVVISDNAHVTDELFKFARRSGRRFLFFQERPHEHWYPGGGIGAAFGG
jgi:hypothetical protein